MKIISCPHYKGNGILVTTWRDSDINESSIRSTDESFAHAVVSSITFEQATAIDFAIVQVRILIMKTVASVAVALFAWQSYATELLTPEKIEAGVKQVE